MASERESGWGMLSCIGDRSTLVFGMEWDGMLKYTMWASSLVNLRTSHKSQRRERELRYLRWDVRSTHVEIM